ncbi:MAG: hypothetical protein ACE5IO_09725, partial [Thermoplasmata archaeon]
YAKEDDRKVRDAYVGTCTFVHVTREAHRHGPKWNESEVVAWGEHIADFVSLGARLLLMLLRRHSFELPGLGEYLGGLNYSFESIDYEDFRRKVCDLFLHVAQ